MSKIKSYGLIKYINSMYKNPKRPLGKFNFWAWFVELVRGCNLACWHCPTRLFPKGELKFMDKETFIALCETIQKLTPYGRLEFCNAGEPTLYPDLLEYLTLARKICPHLQILTYTNGTQLLNGKLTYKQLFDAGINMIFVDMYSPLEVHKKLAEESGYYWYYQDDKPDDAPSVFTYQNNPDIHVIMLAENPSNWSKRKKSRGYFTTYLNDLDWKEASKHGIYPVTETIERRCDIPFKFASVNWDGTFPFCCFDYMRHTVGHFGNIKGGIHDFFEFWFSEYMQDVRDKVQNKNRKAHEYCKICRFTSIRGDIPCWNEKGIFDYYWKNNQWHERSK